MGLAEEAEEAEAEAEAGEEAGEAEEEAGAEAEEAEEAEEEAGAEAEEAGAEAEEAVQGRVKVPNKRPVPDLGLETTQAPDLGPALVKVLVNSSLQRKGTSRSRSTDPLHLRREEAKRKIIRPSSAQY